MHVKVDRWIAPSTVRRRIEPLLQRGFSGDPSRTDHYGAHVVRIDVDTRDLTWVVGSADDLELESRE